MPCDDAYHIVIALGPMLGYSSFATQESGARYAVELTTILITDDGVEIFVRTEGETHAAAKLQTSYSLESTRLYSVTRLLQRCNTLRRASACGNGLCCIEVLWTASLRKADQLDTG